MRFSDTKAGGYRVKRDTALDGPLKESLSYDIINRNFDLLHSHAPLATSYYFRLVNRKKNTNRSYISHKI